MKTEEEIKKGLECCSSGNGCPYETVIDCPYRITNCSCDRAGLMADALQMANEQEEYIKLLCETIDNAAKALGYDCNECNRW